MMPGSTWVHGSDPPTRGLCRCNATSQTCPKAYYREDRRPEIELSSVDPIMKNRNCEVSLNKTPPGSNLPPTCAACKPPQISARGSSGRSTPWHPRRSTSSGLPATASWPTCCAAPALLRRQCCTLVAASAASRRPCTTTGSCTRYLSTSAGSACSGSARSAWADPRSATPSWTALGWDCARRAWMSASKRAPWTRCCAWTRAATRRWRRWRPRSSVCCGQTGCGCASAEPKHTYDAHATSTLLP